MQNFESELIPTRIARLVLILADPMISKNGGLSPTCTDSLTFWEAVRGPHVQFSVFVRVYCSCLRQNTS
jgi:hypothetical protein